MAAPIVYVIISLVMFIIVFGLLMNFAPVVLGAVFNVLDQTMETMGITGGWLNTYNEINALSQYLVPLMLSIGIVLLVVKILMIATNTGQG